uniref:Multifunctional methyltransferase subunit TRM112-like protein n=1 Tax=Bos mutus grunniens TaxID=30521 RepID=A0A8B9WDA3_BOSMU
MRLLTHNLLSSHVRGMGPRGFPLRLQATEVRINPVEFNPDFIVRMIPKVEWAALLEAADHLHLIQVPKDKNYCQPSGSGFAGAGSVDMRLLTHNLLSSHVRGMGPRGFPLRLQATEVRINPVEFNPTS